MHRDGDLGEAMTIAWAISTICGVGHLRPAPGTWGSLAAFPLAWALHVLGGWALLALATCGLFAIGLWATRVQTQGADNHDPSEIVVDEVVGQWISILPVSIGASMMSTSLLVLWPGLVTAFVAFRLFDILKPGPVGWADKRDDALGVMLDDVIAGLLGAGVVVAFAALAHGVLM